MKETEETAFMLEATEFVMTSSLYQSNKLHEEWILDSGCTSHMTPLHGLYLTYKSLVEPLTVKTGGNHTMKAIGVGTICWLFWKEKA
jgi:hypothetical protein